MPVLLDVEVRFGPARGLRPAATLRVADRPVDVVDLVGAALRLGAVDGLTLVPLELPSDLHRVAAEVVPLLAGRGLLRTGRPGPVRERFGIHPTIRTRESA